MPSTHDYAGIAAFQIRTKRNAEIKSFAQALDFLRTESGNTLFRVGYEEVLALRSENLRLRVLAVEPSIGPLGTPTEIGVVLYDTVIVTYRNDETFTTNSGGYLTPTTTSRMGQFTPEWTWFGRANRVLYNRGFYADNNANRFRVVAERPSVAIVGEETPAPVLKRKKAKGAHGTLRWMADGDSPTDIISLNDAHPNEVVFAELDFEGIGRDDDGNYTGDYTAPLRYNMRRERNNSLRGYRGLAKNDVPLDIVNLHRRAWGMPEIELVEQA